MEDEGGRAPRERMVREGGERARGRREEGQSGRGCEAGDRLPHTCRGIDDASEPPGTEADQKTRAAPERRCVGGTKQMSYEPAPG